MAKIITEREYEVHYYEVDYKKRASITSIMNYFSDISIKQSEERNVGLDYMKDMGIAWVLYKWDIDIKRYPIYGEKIIVRTEPYSFRRFYAYRKFYILDRDNNIIVSAKSIWFLINTKTRRTMRINDIMYTAYGIGKDKTDPLDMKKIKKISNMGYEKEFNVRYSDIDTNRHVNNVKYVIWAIESIPIDIVRNYVIKNVTITYKKETTIGETIKVFTEVVNKEDHIICLHKVIDKNGKELTLAETCWVIDKGI